MSSPRGVQTMHHGVPWGTILFLNIVFLIANVDFGNIPFPVHQAASIENLEIAQGHGMPGRRVAFSILGAVAALGVIRGDYRRLRVNGVLGILLLAFLGWACLSIAWADDVAMTGKGLVVLLLLWLGAIWGGLRLNNRDIVIFAFASNAVTWLVSLLVEIISGVFTPWVGGYRFGGLYHPNEAGQCLGVALLAGGTLALQSHGLRRLWFAIAALVAAGFLVLTGSRTALWSAFAGVVAFTTVFSLSSPRLARRTLMVAGVTGAFLCVGYLVYGDDFIQQLVNGALLGRADSDVGTLTLRTPMWRVVIDDFISKRPFTGYGYAGFWTVPHVYALSLVVPGTVYYHSHSGYLEMALSVGVIGAFVHVATIVLALKRSIALYAHGVRTAAFGVAVLVMLLVSMLAEATNMFAYLMPTFTCMIVIAKAAFQAPMTDSDIIALGRSKLGFAT